MAEVALPQDTFASATHVQPLNRRVRLPHLCSQRLEANARRGMHPLHGTNWVSPAPCPLRLDAPSRPTLQLPPLQQVAAVGRQHPAAQIEERERRREAGDKAVCEYQHSS